jgi:SAM-dependent methyltransferase
MPAFWQSSLSTENDPRVGELRRWLDDFYASTTDYDDFNVPSNSKPEYWGRIREVIQNFQPTPDRPHCRVLEFGAGRTGFLSFLGDLRSKVHFTAQDITPQNRDYLTSASNTVHIGDISQLPGPYDVIFSTFVWEHVTNPRALWEDLLKKLAPGGSLFIICPRYDAPGYIPPSARHYGLFGKLQVILWQFARAATGILGLPRRTFLIHTDPAVRHREWFVDADAIHWVSRPDFQRALPPGYSCRFHTSRASGLVHWIVTRYLQVFVQIVRDPAK